MKKKSLLIYLIYTIFTLMSCGPKVQDAKRMPVEVPNVNTLKDTTLNRFANSDFARENLTNRDDASDNFKQAEFLLDIATLTKNPIWKNKALIQFKESNAKISTLKLNFSNSTYLDLVYNQIHLQVNSAIKNTDEIIYKDTDKIISLIRKKQNDLLNLNLDSTLLDKITAVQIFLSSLTLEIKKIDILPDFKDTFLNELNLQSQKLLSDTVDLDNQLVRSENLSTSLNAITSFLEKTQTQINSEDQNNLKLGLQLVNVLNNLNDSQTTLQALTIVWTLLNDQQRKEYFEAANPELYKFLSGKSVDDIQCLSEKNCRGIKINLILNFGVYPAIEKFGIKNILDLINQKSCHFINQKVNQVAYDTLKKIGETISEQVLIAVAQKRVELGNFKDNLRENLSTGLTQFFKDKKIKNINYLLVNSQNVALDFDIQTNYLRNKIKILPFLKLKEDTLQNQFEIIEGLASIPLFSQSPQSPNITIQSDLVNIILNPKPRQYLNSINSHSAIINLKQQSEFLLTTALALNELADWKTSSYDEEISLIQANQILTQFKSPSLNKSFFAKPDLLSIVLSLSSETLKLMQSENTPLLFIDNDNRIIPLQEINNSNTSSFALAAATDIKENQPIQIVKANDLSDFLLSLIQFYSATEGIEKTQSEFLKRQNINGTSLLSELLESRKNIKLLIVATANFISNQLIQKNGLVSQSISLNDHLKPLQKYELLDQTKAIEALIKAHNLTSIDAYLWTAREIYYSMNRILYSDKIKFYQLNTENIIQSGVNKTYLLEAYKNLLILKPYLNKDERTQFDKIFDGWLGI